MYSDDEHEIRLALAWQGPLPHPDDLNAYPKEAQDLVLELYAKECEHRMARQDRVVEASIALDEAESERMDRLVDAEIKQSGAAQSHTVAINLTMVVLAVLLAVLGHDKVAIAMIGALAVVNVTTLFTPLRHGDRRTSRGADGEDDGG